MLHHQSRVEIDVNLAIKLDHIGSDDVRLTQLDRLQESCTASTVPHLEVLSNAKHPDHSDMQKGQKASM